MPIIHQIICNGAWPIQVLATLAILIGKISGDTRCIGVLASVVRLAIQLCAPRVRKWASKVGHPNDSALKGSTGLVLAARRQRWAEHAKYCGWAVISFLWDMDSFYDTLTAKRLAIGMLTMRFPLVPAALTMLTHRAPFRQLRYDGAVGGGDRRPRPLVGGRRFVKHQLRPQLRAPYCR